MNNDIFKALKKFILNTNYNIGTDKIDDFMDTHKFTISFDNDVTNVKVEKK
jgi:hypothetical protein